MKSKYETAEMKEYISEKFYELTPDQICSAVYGSRADLRRNAGTKWIIKKHKQVY